MYELSSGATNNADTQEIVKFFFVRYHCTTRQGLVMLMFEGFKDTYPPEAADQGPGGAGAAIVIDNGGECRAGWGGQAR